MLGAVICMDDAWSAATRYPGVAINHFGQISLALELLQQEYEAVIIPPIDTSHWWGLAYEHWYEGRKEMFPTLPNELIRQVKQVLLRAPLVRYGFVVSHADLRALEPLMKSNLIDKIVVIQKARSEFGEQRSFDSAPHALVCVHLSSKGGAASADGNEPGVQTTRTITRHIALPTHSL